VSHAASFDCAQARSAVEHAVCGDAQLSTLDQQMAQAYRRALNRQAGAAGAAGVLKAEQRSWLAALQPHGAAVDPNALKDRYRARIQALDSVPNAVQHAPDPASAMQGPHYRLTTIAHDYDFEVRMLKPCDPKANDGTCEGPGRILVWRKGQSTPLQTIEMANIFLSMAPNGKPLTNSASLYDYQGVINVGDFNFDGHEDFGVQNGNDGSYGGPSYSIFLFDPTSGQFVENEAMGALIQETLGFFQVDKVNKVLRTLAKDGCCYHESTTYRVVKNEPVAIAKHTEAISDDGDHLNVTDETLVHGTWQSHEHHEPLPK
jgi:hypothetical protein